ncbi:hypothetical protein [Amycolatopsis nalaikhensis]|uniref:Peptidase inhibitor family I36 n=1 Tax=Amycolatopsis nalaikhensis TaxID=715472 RepID=A0ABY8XL22_9PSEU|nr:hypothetical protein [Amycolatopsis sp. 2-2]WIV56260.1 hypothetical protein QP939_46960 [Amycolatopsis sp. 2-2]
MKTRALALAGMVVAATSGLVGPAVAGTTDTEVVCYANALCNRSTGGGQTVSTVYAWRQLSETGATGFFEVFGPNGFKRTGPTDQEVDHTFVLNRTFPNGSLICVSFWRKNADGSFTKFKGVNGNACTSVPIFGA